MKKKFSIYVVAASISLFTSACMQKSFLPDNPKDKEERKDEKGNRWVYNAANSCWMVYLYSLASNHYSSTPYQFYPGTGTWKNASGITTTPPASIPKSAYVSSVKPNSTRSNTGSSYSSGTKSSSSGKVFRSVSPSKSFGA